MIVLLLLFIIANSYLLYIHTSLSLEFVTLVTMPMFVLTFIKYIREYRKENLICFELFFSIAFFIATYSFYMLRELPGGYITSMILENIADETSIARAILVSTLAYLVFILGSVLASYNKNTRPFGSYSYSKLRETTSFLLYLAFFVLFMVFNFSKYMIKKSGADVHGASTWIQWLNISLLLYSVIVFLNSKAKGISSLRAFFKKNTLYCILYVTIVAIHLLSGHRHHALTAILSFVFLYSFCIHRLSEALLIISVIGGYVLLSIIGFTRKGAMLSEYELSGVSLFRDFTSASLATPFFIEYTDRAGFTYGANYIYFITAIVPFLSGLLKSFGLKSAPTSYDFFTDYVQDGDVTTGLGTSLVGDLYYSFGFWGVLLGFFILGYIVSWLYRRLVVFQSRSAYETIVYIVLISNSVFMPRSDYVSWLRMAAFICIFYFLINAVFGNTKALR